MSKSLEIVGHGSVRIGQRNAIDPTVKVIFHRPGTVSLGDYCTLGQGVKIVCDGGDVVIGDWTSLHDRCLVLSTKGVEIGEHGWFGQQTVLDGTGGLRIGHGVRVGMYSQIWSHVAAGEQIEGCTLFGARPVRLEDEVWLVGSCTVASGVTLGRRTTALIGSNITKSWPEGSVLAGSPARPKEGLAFYRPISLDEKWNLLTGWLLGLDLAPSFETLETSLGLVCRWPNKETGEIVVFVKYEAEVSNVLSIHPAATVCCLANKRYTKRLSGLEQHVLKFLSGNKARFRKWEPDPLAE